MVRRFDHVTIVVRDVEKAKQFFSILGFEEAISIVISGDEMSKYMGIHGIVAEHVTLALVNASVRQEVQLLKYRHPDPIPDPSIIKLNKLGFNHVCFAVDDLEAELRKLRANGVEPKNQIMDFHGRKLVFIPGPEGITLELLEGH